MFIVPFSTVVTPLESVTKAFEQQDTEKITDEGFKNPSFLDVFSDIFNNAVETNQQKQEDIIQLTLGNTDNLEQIQSNIAKAEIATDLLVTVKNAVVDTYNEIIKMSI
ncbi:MAG: flagellar hook-basal body complex protein FliE [Firmicutes bacterium]|nr:flagellar hook-basal body complex protein FliE [[Eubacterium] siraeum]MCM1486955.1 flagellar hook-basal body complex protein FliE [Bacillota bacterium]